MSLNVNRVKSKIRLILKSFALFFAVIIFLFSVVIIYVSLHKKQIIEQVTSAISKKMNGKVTIGDVDLSFFENFPKVAVRVKNVMITDTMFAAHKHPFFVGKEVFFTLSVLKMIRRQPPVNGLTLKEASIYMYTDTSGYTNTYLLKTKKDSTKTANTSGGENEFKNIKIFNLHFVLDDRRREKLHDINVLKLTASIDDDEGKLLIHTDADIFVKSLAFNQARGSFLKGKKFRGDFDLQYNPANKMLSFDSIDVRLEGHPFNLSGKFDLGDNAPQFTLVVHTRNVGFELVRTLLPQSISNSLSIVTLDKPLDADAYISGPLKGGEPLLNVDFSAKGERMTTPFLDFDEAGFTGSYSNEVVVGLPRTDPNSKILVRNFTAKWHGLPMSSGKIEILDLLHPKLTADLSSAFPLTMLNEVIGSNSIIMKDGTGAVQLKYQGPIERNTNTNSFLDGNVAFKKGKILYAPRSVELSNVNGSMQFKNSDLYIQKLQANVLGNNVVMDGFAKNLLTLINTEPNKVNIDWNIFSPDLNLASFVYLLKSRGKSSAKKSSDSKLSDVANKIDNALEQSTLNVSLNVTKMRYKKLEASNFIANIRLLQDRYNLDKISMNFGGGSLNLNGALLTNRANSHSANVNAVVNNVNVQQLFNAFDNFGQDGITAKSLEGNVGANVSASMVMDDDGKIQPSSIRSVVNFSLKNGALNNYEPIKKLQNILFKNRDFENITFAEIKDKLEVNGGDIKINRMEIQSNVLSMFVEGLYSNHGKTDISVQVPLSNLKKRGADYIPENIGTDAKAGKSLFIRGQPGPDGNIKFKLDLFKKYQKENTSN